MDKFTPFTKHITIDDEESRVIQFGQHNEKGELNGVGRRTWVTALGTCVIWEG